MISVIILTKNEEQDLPGCLQHLRWCDDVHVLDSGSTDATLDIAKSFNANISYNKFESFGEQRNHALDHLKLKYTWVLFLDADEVVTPEFVNEINETVAEIDANTAGFYCCWKMMLEDRWLKHCDNFPKWQFRLLNKAKARFTDFGHGQKEGEVQGEIKYIREPYLHYSFSKGWAQWIARHNVYSSQEAQARIEKRPPLKTIFAKNTSVRNPALKSWLSKIPGWPLFRFLHTYFINLGFLEGTPGFIYCVNMSYHEFLIQIKMREFKRGKNGKNSEITEIHSKLL